jgi:ribonuclease Z
VSLVVTFLGTAAGVPTLKRSLPAILVQRDGEQLMFDCGEGVQRQMLTAGGSIGRMTKIFVTHMHGDHVMGLPGLLQTMALLSRERKLDVYGPPKLKDFLEGIRETVQFVLTFPIEIHEIERAGVVCKEEEYMVRAARSRHVIPSFAYAYIEKPRPGRFYPERARALGIPEGPLWSKLQRGQKVKLPNGRYVRPEEVMGPHRQGRRIVYTGDTRPFKGLEKFAANADLLIHDSTLGEELAERAEVYGHSTVSQAARSAKRAGVKKLVLTHISQRYEDTGKWLEQARKIFKNTQVAEDFLRIEIPQTEPKSS